jgi:hypothetical protein
LLWKHPTETRATNTFLDLTEKQYRSPKLEGYS